MPQAQLGPIKVPEGPPDERFVYLSDVLFTAWQAVEYAAIPDGGTVAVFGLGPIGQMCGRMALARGASQVFGTDLFPSGSRWRAATALTPSMRAATTTSPTRCACSPTAGVRTP